MIKKLVFTGQELGHYTVLLLMPRVSSSVVNEGVRQWTGFLEERKPYGETGGILILGSEKVEVDSTSSNLLEFGWQMGIRL